MNSRICEGKVVIVTGAGRGIGRGHAIEFARQGAKVVVNDHGGETDGTGSDQSVAAQVVTEIQAMGGEAVANGDDISEWEGAQRLVNTAVETFGELHVVVNNAGILRDRMLTNMTEGEWDSVIKVHLKGTFAPTRWAAAYWRERFKANDPVDGAAIINTSSTSGLYGNQGQVNYGAAKAGIGSLTIIAAAELARFGVTVNAVSPAARTRMTENLGFGRRPDDAETFDAGHAHNVAPTVVWLGSNEPEAREVTGRIFLVNGGNINCMEGWMPGPGVSKDDRWEPGELTDVIPGLVEEAAENMMMVRQRERTARAAEASTQD